MRISTANSYQRTIENLQKRQSELADLQAQLSTGKRVQKASDDPVSATLSEAARNRMSRTEADLRSLNASRTSLEQAESALGDASEIIQDIRTLMISAGNGSYGPNEREDIARQLESLRERLVGVANLGDNAGRALFGGLGGSPTPFVDQYGPTGVIFEGQRGQTAAGDTSLPQTLDGHAIWMSIPSATGNTNIFQVVQDAIDATRNPDGAVRTQALADSMTELDAGLDRVLLARGRAGEWLNRADSLEALLKGRSDDYEIEISRLEDMDLVRGISDFQSKQTGLEAALKAYAQVQQLSLFKVI